MKRTIVENKHPQFMRNGKPEASGDPAGKPRGFQVSVEPGGFRITPQFDLHGSWPSNLPSWLLEGAHDPEALGRAICEYAGLIKTTETKP